MKPKPHLTTVNRVKDRYVMLFTSAGRIKTIIFINDGTILLQKIFSSLQTTLALYHPDWMISIWMEIFDENMFYLFNENCVVIIQLSILDLKVISFSGDCCYFNLETFNRLRKVFKTKRQKIKK